MDDAFMKIREDIDKTAAFVVQCMIEKKLSVSAAESCTGGMFSSAVTSVPGASEIFECGIVSYSDRIKEEVLGVAKDTIERFGVVSENTAEEMAKNVKRISGSDFSVGITGLAGPGGDGIMPAGTVYLSVLSDKGCRTENLKLYGMTRQEVRLRTVLTALKWIKQQLEAMTA